MLRRQLVRRLGLAMLAVFVLQQIASFLHWFSLVWWFDMPMHFLGGFAMFYLSALVFFRKQPALPWQRYLALCVASGLAIGAGWEAFELGLAIRYGFPPFHFVDSLSDMCFDAAGLCLAAYGAAPLLRSSAAPRV